MQKVKPNAERTGVFVQQLLQGMFGGIYYQPVEESTKQEVGSKTDRGLYMFFVTNSGNVTDRYYYAPIYVGITSRTFNQRFKEHAQDGVIHKFLDWQSRSQEFLPKCCRLYVSEFIFDAPAAKLLESVFLEAFDFPLNVRENDKARLEYEVSKESAMNLSTAKEVFEEAYERVNGGVKTVQAKMKTVQAKMNMAFGYKWL